MKGRGMQNGSDDKISFRQFDNGWTTKVPGYVLPHWDRYQAGD